MVSPGEEILLADDFLCEACEAGKKYSRIIAFAGR
jgi:hypothetical protein